MRSSQLPRQSLRCAQVIMFSGLHLSSLPGTIFITKVIWWLWEFVVVGVATKICNNTKHLGLPD